MFSHLQWFSARIYSSPWCACCSSPCWDSLPKQTKCLQPEMVTNQPAAGKWVYWWFTEYLAQWPWCEIAITAPENHTSFFSCEGTWEGLFAACICFCEFTLLMWMGREFLKLSHWYLLVSTPCQFCLLCSHCSSQISFLGLWRGTFTGLIGLCKCNTK